MRATMLILTVVVMAQVACSGAMKKDAGKAGGVLEFSKDTVYEDYFFGPDFLDTIRIINKGATVASIETVFVAGTTPEVDEYEVSFVATSTSGFERSYSLFNYENSTSLPIEIMPGHPMLLAFFQFDRCVACPVGKRGELNTRKDTVTADLVFTHHPGADTLRIVGLFAQSSASNTIHLRNASISASRIQPRTHSRLDLRGRRRDVLRRTTGTSVEWRLPSGVYVETSRNLRKYMDIER